MNANDPTEKAWARVRLAFWLAAAAVLLLWRGPALRDALEPSFFRPLFYLPDFFQEWASARNALEGLPVYSPHAVTAVRYLDLPIDKDDPYFRVLPENAHPPCAVLLGLPFAFIDFPDALLLWNLISLALLAASVFIVVTTLGLHVAAWQVVAGFCALLLCYPLQDHLLHGQLNLLLLFLITLAWRADHRRQSAQAGIWTAAAAALKLFPGFLLLYFLVLRKWRALLWAGLAGAGFGLLAVAILGVDASLTYFREVLPRAGQWRARWDNYSLSGLSFKLFQGDNFAGSFAARPLVVNPRLAWTSAALSLALLAGVVAWLVHRLGSRGDHDRAFAVTVNAMVLASPTVWTHYFVLLILPLLIVWPRLDRLGREILIFMVALLCAPPWKLAEYALILLYGSADSSGPWQTLTALSLPCYAQLGILALVACAPPRPARQPENRL